MDNIFYGHLSDTERELAIYESKFNIDIKKAELMSIYAEKMDEIKEMEAELRVLTECGTYDDLVAYYEAEAEENNDQKESAVGAFFKAIGDFIQGVITAIANVFKSPEERKKEEALKKAKGEVTVLDPNKGIFAPFNRALDTFKNTFSKEATEQEAEQAETSINTYINQAQEALDNFIPSVNLIGTAGGVLNVAAITHSSLKYWQGELPTIKVKISEASSKVSGAVTSALSNVLKTFEAFTGLNDPSNSKVAEKYNNAKNKIKEFIDGIKGIPNRCKDFVSGLFGIAKKNDPEIDDDINEDDIPNDDNGPTTGGNEGKADDKKTDDAKPKQVTGVEYWQNMRVQAEKKLADPNTTDEEKAKIRTNIQKYSAQIDKLTAGKNGSAGNAEKKPAGQTPAPTNGTPASGQNATPAKQQTNPDSSTVVDKGSKSGVEYYKNLKSQAESKLASATTDEEKEKLRNKIKKADEMISKLTPKTSTAVTKPRNLDDKANPNNQASNSTQEEMGESSLDDFFADLESYLR